MASGAFDSVLTPLLADVEELLEAHRRLRTRQRGRQWRLGALNRAAVVVAVSAWESYVEEIVRLVVAYARPAHPPRASWHSWETFTANALKRFNTPDVGNTRKLIRDCLGIHDLTRDWYWRNCPVHRSRARLEEAIQIRHHVAHGVNPRPIVHNTYARQLPGFFRNLAHCTDETVRLRVVSGFGLPSPW